MCSQVLRGFIPAHTERQLQFEDNLKSIFGAEVFKAHLYAVTSEPHYAGSLESRRVIEYLSQTMEQAGLEVIHYDYDVLLSDPGTVEINLIIGDEIKELNIREYVYEEDSWSAHPALTHGWNAYSASGDVASEFVYVNYGTKEDFELLDSLQVSLVGKIALARYGRNFRGYKARYAEAAGAVGLVIFTDPSSSRLSPEKVYPHTQFLDESAIQRGSLITLNYYGDPLTPFEPALPLDHPKTPERLPIDQVDLPGIPVAPIGSAAAAEILTMMRGDKAPEQWQGGFDFPYNIQSGVGVEINLNVDQTLEIKRITNVIGKIEGAVYPDEWVILGCHHDAWTFGTSDPNSGTAMLLTLSDAFGQFLSQGWRPDRTIVFAHWDAEEFGLIGSSEWVEHKLSELMEKAVIYINADMTVTGPRFGASATPSLHTSIIEAAAAVTHPDTNLSLLDYWTLDTESGRPAIGRLGSGSDFAPFVLHATIPAAQIGMYGNVPVYHSAFDNLHYYEKFLDGDFKYGPTLASYYGVLVSRFANADILPYDLHRFSVKLRLHLEELENTFEGLSFDDSHLMDMLALLENQAAFYNELLNDFSKYGIPQIEMTSLINRELIQWERNFLIEEGLSFNSWMRNLFISPDPFQGYAAWVLPAFRYALLSEDSIDSEAINGLTERHIEVMRKLLLSMHRINDLFYGE